MRRGSGSRLGDTSLDQRNEFVKPLLSPVPCIVCYPFPVPTLRITPSLLPFPSIPRGDTAIYTSRSHKDDGPETPEPRSPDDHYSLAHQQLIYCSTPLLPSAKDLQASPLGAKIEPASAVATQRVSITHRQVMREFAYMPRTHLASMPVTVRKMAPLK